MAKEFSLYTNDGADDKDEPPGGIILAREDELLNRMKQGDPAAADELIQMFYQDILRYCLWHAPNRSLAEDATQETFLKAIRYFDRYAHRGKFKPFLYRIAANTCIDMHRKHQHTELSLEAAEIDPAYSDPAFEQIRSDMVVRQLVGVLPENQREIVLLRFGQDLTLREIAEVVNLPLRTVQTRLRAALKRLRTELSSPQTEPDSRQEASNVCNKKEKRKKGGCHENGKPK